jgi:cytochrome P450
MAAEARAFLASPEGGRTDLMELLMHLLLALNRRTLLQVELTESERDAIVGFEVDLMYGINTSIDPEAHYAGMPYCRARESVFALLDRQVAARLAGERREDNLQALVDQEAGTLGALTAEELRYDSYLLLIAGIENSSRLIARAVERLAAHPDWAAAIREELRDYGDASFARGVGAFPRLRAFIQETERLHPGLLFMSRRAARALDFQGRVIPTGRTVLQVHTLLHFLPEYYPDPMRFDPTRWLTAEPPRRTHLTFGGGAHVCLGMNIARLQMPIVLAELVRRYDVTLGYEPTFGYSLDPGLGRRPHHFPVSLRRRN